MSSGSGQPRTPDRRVDGANPDKWLHERHERECAQANGFGTKGGKGKGKGKGVSI